MLIVLAVTPAQIHRGRNRKNEAEKSMPLLLLDRMVMMKDDVTANRANPIVPKRRCCPHLWPSSPRLSYAAASKSANVGENTMFEMRNKNKNSQNVTSVDEASGWHIEESEQEMLHCRVNSLSHNIWWASCRESFRNWTSFKSYSQQTALGLTVSWYRNLLSTDEMFCTPKFRCVLWENNPSQCAEL